MPPTSREALALRRLVLTLERVRRAVLAMDARAEAEPVPTSARVSVRNLLHYLAFRRHDLRPLLVPLADRGVSSLGRAECHVLNNLEKVLGHLRRQLGDVPLAADAPAVTLSQGRARLARRTRELLGAARDDRPVRIMLTAPSEAATDPAVMAAMVRAGMDVLRINCAHDHPAAWQAMIGHLRRATRGRRRRVLVMMDLPGPKVRTGPIAPGPRVLRWTPPRDALGRNLRPARLWLTPRTDGTAPELAEAVLPVPAEPFARLRPGQRLRFRDNRDRRLSAEILAVTPAGAWASCPRGAYVCDTTEFFVERSDGQGQPAFSFTLPGLPATSQTLLLRAGDTLRLTAGVEPGAPAVLDAEGRVLDEARVPFSLPALFGQCRVGEPIFFDDGKIGGVIERASSAELRVRVTSARAGGARLGPDKGINLPDTEIRLPALAESDVEHLKFVAAHADIVALSFVKSAQDVFDLQRRLTELGRPDLGVVLKIETQRAFENLPAILLAGLRSRRVGVMIARGDLAVECGWLRLAEIQEEILWLAEAAHVPVIWATQVLERLAKRGQPSRAEITDAAMSQRAECVMLNKGPYLVEACRALDDILRRMAAHQDKKSPVLRPLSVAANFVACDKPRRRRLAAATSRSSA